MWETILVIAVVVLIVGGAAAYVIRAKKKGVKCVGCPHSKECGSCKCCNRQEEC